MLDPARPRTFPDSQGAGKHLAGAVLRVHGLTGTAADDADSDAVRIGSSGRKYGFSCAFLAGHHRDFADGAFRLPPGTTRTGAVTFAALAGSGSPRSGGPPAAASAQP